MAHAGGVLQRSLSAGGGASGPDPFWSDGVNMGTPDLDNFLRGLLSETVDLNAALVPSPLAVSFGLSTDSTVICVPPSAAAALGKGTPQSAQGLASSQPVAHRRPPQQPDAATAAPQPAAAGTATGSKEHLLLPVLPSSINGRPTQGQPPVTTAGLLLARTGASPAQLCTASPKEEPGQQEHSCQPPTSFSGLLTKQAAAAAAALAEAPHKSPQLTEEGVEATAEGGDGPSQNFGSADREQQAVAPPHLRYDFAQAQQDQAAVVVQFQQQQQVAAVQAQQRASAMAMFVQQQAYQQQAFQQQQQAAVAGQGQPPNTAASAAAYYQGQHAAAAAAAAAAAYGFQHPYGAWGAMYSQYGQQQPYGGQQPYGQQQYSSYSYPPYGAQMQFPGMQYPGMQQQMGGQMGGASAMNFPPVQGASVAAGAGTAATAAAAVLLPPLQAPLQGVTEVVNQSEGAAHGGGLDDDPCALKKARLIWTPALHRRFLEAVERVGGVDKALPKAVMKEMGVSGLTRENVASHLQKHRMRLKREEEEGGGAGDHSGHLMPAASGRGAPRAMQAAAGTQQGEQPDAEMPDAMAGTAAANKQDGAAAAADAQCKPLARRSEASCLATVPSELSDGRTAAGSGV